jgi:hypothetical protein
MWRMPLSQILSPAKLRNTQHNTSHDMQCNKVTTTADHLLTHPMANNGKQV